MAAALLWARTNLRSQWRSAALVVRLAPGGGIAAVRSEMSRITGGFERVIGESFAGLLTLLVLAHSLATVASRRRHDLSVLRAIGMRPKQARHVLWWHGGMLAVLAIAIGLPLGVMGGRLLWHAVSNSIDSVYSPRSPWPVLVIVAGGLLILSVASGAAFSGKAVPHPIARSLRSE